jgi:ferric-dicitrate binding protein FerR (iron transport regulator)
MKKTLIASALAFTALTAVTQPPSAIDYRFEQVKHTVTVSNGTQELNVAAGAHARSGARVTTGFFSYALIAAEQYRARFEIFGSTTVQLAEGTPGVLLSVERGKIRAMFDKITGSEPRVVKTPGALLAVRGTQFDVEVDNAGKTTVDVFEGVVEVRSDMLREPVLVHPGEQSTFGRNQPPNVHPMPDDHRRNDPTRQPGGDGHGVGGRGEPSHQPPPGGRGPTPPPPGGHH